MYIDLVLIMVLVHDTTNLEIHIYNNIIIIRNSILFF